MRRLFCGVGLAAMVVAAQAASAADNPDPGWTGSLKSVFNRGEGSARSSSQPRNDDSRRERSGAQTSVPQRSDVRTTSETPLPIARRAVNPAGRAPASRRPDAPGFSLSDDSPSVQPESYPGQDDAKRPRNSRELQAERLRTLAESNGLSPGPQDIPAKATRAAVDARRDEPSKDQGPPPSKADRQKNPPRSTSHRLSDEEATKTPSANSARRTTSDTKPLVPAEKTPTEAEKASFDEEELAQEPIAKASWTQVWKNLFSTDRK